MSYQTALSGLDWSMVPSGMSVPAAGIVAMATYESGMGAILASNNVGSLNINISSSNYTGTIGDITNEIIAISGTTSSNRTITLYFNASTQNGVKSYKVYIPSASLVAGSGGPYTLTITTGSGNSVWVPISATGNTLYSTSGVSNNLMFNIYVDSSGNVTSDDWQISGSNSNGSFVQFADGTMIVMGFQSITTSPTYGSVWWYNWTSPSGAMAAGFISPPMVTTSFIAGGSIGGSFVYSLTGSSISVGVFTSNLNEAYIVEYTAIGRWR